MAERDRKNWIHRHIRVLYFAAIGIFVLYVAVMFRGLFNSTFNLTDQNKDAKLSEQPNTPYNFVAYIRVIPPDGLENGGRLQINILNLSYKLTSSDNGPVPSKVGKDQFLCIYQLQIEQLNLRPGADFPATFAGKHMVIPQKPLCHDAAEGAFLPSDSGDPSSFEFIAMNSPRSFWYPWDDIDYSFEHTISISYAVVSEKPSNLEAIPADAFTGRTMPSRIQYLSDSQVWDYSVSILSKPFPGDDEEDAVPLTWLHIDLWRPVMLKVIPVVLVALIVAIMGAFSYIDDLNIFIEACIAVLFGTIAIRQSVVPANIQTPTVWDNILFGLYILLAITIAIHLLKMRLQTEQQKHSQIFIGNNGTRSIHLSSCAWVNNISPKNRIEIQDIHSALEDGYSLCGTCFAVSPPNANEPVSGKVRPDKRRKTNKTR